MSFLYRNAGWALQAGICWRGLTSITTHTSEVLGIKVITIWWPSTSTDHNRDFGPGVGSFEARIADFESCPQLPFGRKHPGAWAPNLGKFLCVILREISGGEGVFGCFCGLAEARTTLCALAPERGCKKGGS